MPATLSDEALRRIAAAWLETAGYAATDTNIVGEPLIDVVLDGRVPQRIAEVIGEVFGVDLSACAARPV